jgi:predicted lipoprotein with Yx(FWY)xxD motif
MKIRTLGLFVLALVVVAACGGEGGDDTTTVVTDAPEVTTTADTGQEATTTTGATATTVAMDTTTTAAEAMEGVHAMETDLGTVLVDPDGLTLYVFTQDSDGESACYDACAESWPPVAADTPISSDLDDSMFGSIERTDGTAQLTINGMPLYLFASDAGPGDINGHGVNDVWFAVDAEGNMLEASAATQLVTDEDEDIAYDYDY